jgi:(p)ppGpp synthase/HD superfamily hydrolase
MGSYSQTILQLQGQLRQSSYSVSDQEYVARAYRLAAGLFSGQFRGSGKTFIAHLVGTASILVFCEAPMRVVAAGLLHAAYDQGDFGFGLRGRHRDKKQEIIQAVGAEAEDYLQRYFQLRWTTETIASLPARAATMSATEQRVVLIRLANELEDHSDCGIQFCANRAQRMDRMLMLADALVDLARPLGYPVLAEELSRSFAENRSTVMAEGLREQSSYSALNIPRSCRRRYITLIRSYLSRRLDRSTGR